MGLHHGPGLIAPGVRSLATLRNVAWGQMERRKFIAILGGWMAGLGRARSCRESPAPRWQHDGIHQHRGVAERQVDLNA
jgi:hypothetical protein